LAREVVSFLDGRDDVLYERLWAGLESAAERLDFERAGKLRRDLQSVLGIVDHQKRLREASELHNLLVVLPSADVACREVLLVLGGRRWAQIRASRAPALDRLSVAGAHGDEDRPLADVSVPVRDLADRLANAWERYTATRLAPVDHHGVDETSILNRWLFRQAGHPALIPLPDPAAQEDAPYWAELAASVLGLSDGDLVFAEAYNQSSEEDVELNEESLTTTS
jgi:hypothetical protein